MFLLLYSMILPPPRSTLFPYTTLFRSSSKLRVYRYTVPIVSQVRGRVLEVPIEEGNRLVKKGEVLFRIDRSEEHTSELQSRFDLVCRLLLEKKKKKIKYTHLYATTIQS